MDGQTGWTKIASGVGLGLAVVLAVASWQKYATRVADEETNNLRAAVAMTAGEVTPASRAAYGGVQGIRVEAVDRNGLGMVMVEPVLRVSDAIVRGGVDTARGGVALVKGRDGAQPIEMLVSLEGLGRGEVTDLILRAGDSVRVDQRDWSEENIFAVGGDGPSRAGTYAVESNLDVLSALLQAGCDPDRQSARWVVVRRKEGNLQFELAELVEIDPVPVKSGDVIEMLPSGKRPSK